MRCPTLAELPLPPPGKTGWPWTEESPQLPATMPDGSPWPKISIVTPSFNQGQFIEETIRSVLLQGYPNLEYIIIDGGSKDESAEIIRKYEPWLTYWISEKDRGQSHAINKGFEIATGDIFAWINSDDYYLAGAFDTIGQAYKQTSDDAIFLGYGNVINRDGAFLSERKIQLVNENILLDWRNKWFLQQAVFWPSICWETVKGIDERYELLLDYDLWFRFLKHYSFRFIDKPLAVLRCYDRTKSHNLVHRSYAEMGIIRAQNGKVDDAIEYLVSKFEKSNAAASKSHRNHKNIFFRTFERLGFIRNKIEAGKAS